MRSCPSTVTRGPMPPRSRARAAVTARTGAHSSGSTRSRTATTSRRSRTSSPSSSSSSRTPSGRSICWWTTWNAVGTCRPTSAFPGAAPSRLIPLTPVPAPPSGARAPAVPAQSCPGGRFPKGATPPSGALSSFHGEGDVERHRSALQQQREAVALLDVLRQPLEIGERPELLAVDLADHVAALHAGFCGGAPVLDTRDDDALGRFQIQLAGDLGG